jgi:hypothetical protein
MYVLLEVPPMTDAPPTDPDKLGQLVDRMARVAWQVFFLSLVGVVGSILGAELLDLIAARLSPYNPALPFILDHLGHLAFVAWVGAGAAILATTAAMRGESFGWKALEVIIWLTCAGLTVVALLWLVVLLPPAIAAAKQMLETTVVTPPAMALAILCPLFALFGAWELGNQAAALPPLAVQLRRYATGDLDIRFVKHSEEPGAVDTTEPRREEPPRRPPPTGKVDDYF